MRPKPRRQKDYSKYPFMNLSLKDMKGEEWIDIPQFDGYYAVSNYGRIWALPRPVHLTTGQQYYTKERIRKQLLAGHYNSYTKDYTDQLTVKLRYGPESFSFQVCRLVYELFVGPIGPNLSVVHKDGDNCNNRYDNLVLMNGTEIYAQGLKLNRRPRTSRMVKKRKQLVPSIINSPRPIVKYSLQGKKLCEYESIALAATTEGVHRASIRQIALKRLKQLHGFVYRYKGDPYKGEHADFSWEKPVTQYSVEGRKLTVYPSVKVASLKTGVDPNTISRCALRKERLGSGYVWRYQGDTYKGEYNGTITNKPRAMIQYALNGKQVARFRSANEASVKTGFSAATLLDCAHKRAKVSHGFVWRFEGDAYKGEYRNYRSGKPVTQHTLEGVKVHTYSTIEAAARATGLTPDNIQKNVKGENKTAGGYIWKYATSKEIKALPDFEPAQYDRKNVAGKEVIQYSLEGKKIARYPTIADAARACNIASSNISSALNKARTSNGYVWRTKGNRYRGELADEPMESKPRMITQYSLDGKKIRTFKSMREAERVTGVFSTTLSAVAKGKLRKTGGFIWQYGDGPKKIDIEAHYASRQQVLKKMSKVVVKYSLEGEYISEYPSIAEAARAEGVSAGRISSAVNGSTKSALGFYWGLKKVSKSKLKYRK